MKRLLSLCLCAMFLMSCASPTPSVVYYRSDGTPYATQSPGKLPQPLQDSAHVSTWDDKASPPPVTHQWWEYPATILMLPLIPVALGVGVLAAAHQNTLYYGPTRCSTYTYKDQYHARCY